MKKILFSLIVLVSLFGLNCLADMVYPDTTKNIYTDDFKKDLKVDDINDPLRNGAYNIPSKIKSLFNKGEITQHKPAMSETLNLVKKVINFLLGLLALVSLVYLIYNGFLMVTAAGDDTQYKKGLKSLKYAAIAIGGIGISRLFVSFIFWLVTKFTV